MSRWRAAATDMHVPYDHERRVHQQCDGFTNYAEWDFSATPESAYPLLLHRPYFQLYRTQVIKQADLVLAMHWCGDEFSAEDKVRNVDYYERRTVRDSSLSPCTQAIMNAEVGHVQLAYDYLAEAALMDLRDLENNTGDGLHMASLAGAWLAVVAGLGGLRDFGGILRFDPVLPQQMTGLEFNIRWRGAKLKVAIRDGQATYSVHDGPRRLGHPAARRAGADRPCRRAGQPATGRAHRAAPGTGSTCWAGSHPPQEPLVRPRRVRAQHRWPGLSAHSMAGGGYARPRAFRYRAISVAVEESWSAAEPRRPSPTSSGVSSCAIVLPSSTPH